MGTLFHWVYQKIIKIKNFMNKKNLKWKKLKYWKPGIKEFFLMSHFLDRLDQYRKLKKFRNEIKGKVLDIGCGTKPYEHLFNCDEYIGLEILNSACREDADVLYDGNKLPFPDNYFDSVVSFGVFSQVEEINSMLQEIRRVTKPKGKFLLSCTFIWYDDTTVIENRFSKNLMAKILSENKFQIIKSETTCNNLSALILLLNHHLYNEFIVKIRFSFIRRIIKIITVSAFNIIGYACLNLLPKTKDLYISRISLATIK